MNLDQGTNGGVGKPPVSPVKWQNGNANENNSHFTEGDSIPYHMVLENLTLGSHTVEIEWDIRHSGANAIDFITSFGRISETVNPLLTTQGNPLPGGPFVANTFAIPTPPVSGTVSGSPASPTVGGLVQPTTRFNSLPAAEKLFTIYNGTGATLTYINNAQGVLGDLTANQSATRMSITFTATSPTVVFAWGGHIGRRLDWGVGNSAGGVNGSPYHTRLISLDGSGGNQDRSLSAASIIDPPDCDVTGLLAVCAASTNTHTAVTGAASPTYLWSITGLNTSGATIVGSLTGSTVQVLAGSGGSYTISVAITANNLTTTCFDEVTVAPLPDCTISGANGPLCPNLSGNQYSGVAGLSSYAWSITGNGSIVGVANTQTVSVTAGAGCASTFTLTLTVTNASGCTSTCTKTVTVEDTAPPVFTFCPPGSNLGCNPAGVPAPGTATATDACGAPAITSALGAITTDGCLRSQTRTYTATDGCTNTATCTQVFTWTVDITPPVFTFCPPGSNLGCNPAGVPAPGAATATDACGTPVITSALGTVTSTGCQRSQTRTYTATDGCTNTATCTQVFTWTEDITPPVIICPPSASVPYPSVPAPATTVAELVGLGGSASDTCGAVTISSRDSEPTGACPAVITRTYTAIDECGNPATCEQKINQFCPSLVTSSSLCTFDVDSNCDDAFRLNFQQRTDVPSLQRIVSSNPGQFYYNFFVYGNPGDDVNATATIPYPFVTHGSQPVHVYSDYTITGSDEAGYCLIPGTGLGGFTITTAGGQKSTSGGAIIVLGDYTPAALTTTTTVNVSGGKIPASGTICVTIHLDYALKKTNQWTQSLGAAVGTGSLTGVTLNPCQEYAFSFTDGVVNDEQIVHSVNGFKKNTGFAASIVTSPELGSNPLQGVKFEAWNSTGTTKIGQGFTGVDGSGLIPYRQKAKAEDYWIKVPAYQKAIKVSVKANGLGYGEFEVP